MSEWSYLMLVEAVVFLLCAVGTIQVQNTVIPLNSGINNATPVVVSAVTGTLFVGAICLGLALALSLNIDSDSISSSSVDSILCIGLTRGVRGMIGVILLFGSGFAILVNVSSDWEDWISFYSGNQLITNTSLWKFHLFAVILTGLICSISVCLLLSIHTLLKRIYKTLYITTAHPPPSSPRLTWTVSMALLVLTETQFVMYYNAAHAYAKRPVFISISTIMTASFIFIADVTIVKIFALRMTHVTWFRILASFLYIGTLCVFGIQVILHTELNNSNNRAANIFFLVFLFMAIIADVYIFFSSMPTIIITQSTSTPPDTVPTSSSISHGNYKLPYNLGILDDLITTGSRAHSTVVIRDNLRPRTLKLKQKLQ